jgi:hypothetical protein
MSNKGEDMIRFTGVDPACDLHFPTEGFEKSVVPARSERLCRAGWILCISGVALILLDMLGTIATVATTKKFGLPGLWTPISLLGFSLAGTFIIVGTMLVKVSRDTTEGHRTFAVQDIRPTANVMRRNSEERALKSAANYIRTL